MPPEYEYQPLRLPPGTGRVSAQVQLSIQAEFGGWELAKLRLFHDGTRQVTLRRRRTASPLPRLSVQRLRSDDRFNLAAAGIVLILTAVICIGIEISSRVNAVLVTVKVTIVLFVIVAGAFFIEVANYSPFIPPTGTKAAPAEEAVHPSLLQDLGFAAGSFGLTGIFTGAALVCFAFIGFTAAEETKQPQRDLPIGIIASLLICTTLYVAVSLVVTGMVKFNELDTGAPLASAFEQVGRPGFATIISIGALTGLTTVMMILMLGQSRVFFAMSRDRLLPERFSFYLMLNLPTGTWIGFGIQMALGFVMYFLYAQRNSRLNDNRPGGIDSRDVFIRDRDSNQQR